MLGHFFFGVARATRVAIRLAFKELRLSTIKSVTQYNEMTPQQRDILRLKRLICHH
jgi:hypothetical protein